MSKHDDLCRKYYDAFQEFIPRLMDIPQRFVDELAQVSLDRGSPITRDEINEAARRHSRKDVVY